MFLGFALKNDPACQNNNKKRMAHANIQTMLLYVLTANRTCTAVQVAATLTGSATNTKLNRETFIHSNNQISICLHVCLAC